MKTFVFYHAECPDGFAAAVAASMEIGPDAKYVPIAYGDVIPELPRGCRVIFVDFFPDWTEAHGLSRWASEIVILDHHHTAIEKADHLYNELIKDHGTSSMVQISDTARVYAFERLGQYARVNVKVVKEYSGAALAWRYFHAEPLPLMLRYIQDRDLWRWKELDSRRVNYYLNTLPHDFPVWRGILEHIEHSGIEDCARAGGHIENHIKRCVERIGRQARTRTLGGYAVPVVNATEHVDEVGEHLLERYPKAPFSASYRVCDDRSIKFSLRSRGDFDVSTIAGIYKGGGGHKSAAGFKIQTAHSGDGMGLADAALILGML